MSETPTSPNTSRFDSEATQFHIPHQEELVDEARNHAQSANTPEVVDEKNLDVSQIGQNIDLLREDKLAA